MEGHEEFSFQMDVEGEITVSNDVWKSLNEDDQNDVLIECQEVLKNAKPKRIHKALRNKFYDVIVVPVYSPKYSLEGIVVNGFSIHFTLFDNIVINNIVDVAFLVSLKDGEFYLDGVNNRMEQLTGMKKQNVLGKPVKEILPKEVVSRALEKNFEAIKSGKTVQWEECANYPIGLKYFDVSVTPIYNVRGDCQGLIGTAHDVTATKTAEMEKYKNYSILNGIIEGTSDAIFVKDLEGRYILVNTSGAKLLGISPYEHLQKRDFELFSEETAMQFVLSDREVLQDGIQRTYEEDVVINNRRYDFLSVKGVYRNLDGKAAGTYGISRDITKMKKYEKELKLSNSLLKATLNATADGILVLDKNHKITMFNDKFLELWKLSKEYLEETSYEEILTQVLNQLSNPEECWDRLEELELNPGMRSYDIIEFKDGRVFERYTIPQIINKEIVGRVFSYRDIGPRKTAEEKRKIENGQGPEVQQV